MPSDNCPLFLKYGAHGKVIAVDLDGTIFANRFPEIGTPLPGVVTRMRRLKELGCHIIIHTARIGPHYEEIWGQQLGKIHNALVEHGIPYDEVWMGEGKPLTCAILDDKSYKSVAEYLQHIENNLDR